MAESNRAGVMGRRMAFFSVGARRAPVTLMIALVTALKHCASNLEFARDFRVFFRPDNPAFMAIKVAREFFGKPGNLAFVIAPERDLGLQPSGARS